MYKNHKDIKINATVCFDKRSIVYWVLILLKMNLNQYKEQWGKEKETMMLNFHCIQTTLTGSSVCSCSTKSTLYLLPESLADWHFNGLA